MNVVKAEFNFIFQTRSIVADGQSEGAVDTEGGGSPKFDVTPLEKTP